jgi:4-hydroxy-tetrahydrodipicolinate synthase
MTHETTKAGLRAVATGILTPFDDDLAVDHAALAANARAIADAGIGTVLACANVSEYHSLSHEERVAVTETSVEALPTDVTVLAGAGGSTKTTIDLASAYAALGVDAIMVMPPMHTYKHERGLLSYYRQIGDAVEVPLVPYLRGFDPSVEFVADLTRLESVSGVKWTIPDVPKFARSVRAGADDVVWMTGVGERYAIPVHMEGAEGQSSGIGNFEPVVGLALDEALDAGDLERAREIRDAALPFMAFREEAGEDNAIPNANSVPALKAGLEFAGLTGGPVREPLVDLSDAEYERARTLYDDLAAFIDAEL